MLERDFYPLTSPQFSIWYTEKMYAGTSISNISGTIRIKEDNINYGFLEKALKLYIKNNESIRLRICVDENGEPRQYAYPYEDKPVDFIDFSKYEDPISAMYEWNANEAKKPLRLLDSDLYRFVILKISDKEGGIYSNFHHIIFDAWSMALSCSLVMGYYKALKTGDIEQAEQIDIPSYISYVKSEMDYYKSNRMKKDAAFWEEVYDKPIEATVLKTRKTNLVSTESKRKTFVAPKKFVRKLRQYCAENRTTLYPLFLSALSMYVNRVTGKEDIIIGTPILNRLNQTEKNTVGMFVSTVPLRIKVSDETSFTEFSHSILQICSSSYRHQRYPYELILKKVREKHDFPGNLYDIVLSYQNSKYEKTDIDYSTRWHFNGHQSNSLTIHVNDRDDDETVIIDYDYHKDLYYDKEIEFIHHHLLSLLWHALDNPEKKICTIEMLPESEKRKVLCEFNNTEADYPKDKTIHQLFEQQVTKTPDNIALICDDKSITYKELNEKANSLAVLLREKGIKPGDVIGILVSRSIEMVIGMLAVLKAGAAFLPIDKELPEERINYMIENSKSSVILTDNTTEDKLTGYDIINLQCDKCYIFGKENLKEISKVHDLAYVLYTSGTTGDPKGVMIEHTSLVNFVCAVNKFMDFSTDSIVLSYTSFCFDIFIFETFTSLLTGARIILANETEQKIPRYTCGLIKKHKVNKVLTTPSKIKLLLMDNENIKTLESIKEIMVGGEIFPPELLKSLKNNLNAKIINGYGPTETTIGVSFKVFDNDNRITIGKPIANVKLYVLDKNKNLLPIGIPGELYIGGLCLGRGYINNNELTNNVFIKNPFNPNETLYKTGDIVKWCSGGEIEFLGRIDSQVKIRGYRVELDEIKNQLLKIEGIDDAAVIKFQRNGKEMICSYIVKNPKKKITPNNIKNHLSKFLPKYMIPLYYVEVERIPINANGKIDLKKLPKPIKEREKERILKPKNDTENEVLNIWKDVLQKKSISTDKNIHDAGGDSLSIINIISQVYSKFNVELPLSDIDKIDTVKKMAFYIDKNREKSIKKHINERIVLLKKAEKSECNLFLLHAGNGEINNYIKLSGYLDAACWGIRFGASGIAPQNISINQVAKEYINMIKEIQPNGPYTLGGWCIGGTTAYEMANILEHMGDKVDFVFLFNSISPKDWPDIKPFSYETEMHLIRSFFGNGFDDEIVRQVESRKDINDLWEFITDKKIEKNSVISQLPDEVRDAIPDLERIQTIDLFRYINRIRTLHQARAFYKPQSSLDAQIVFFNAVYDNIISDKELNISDWNSYCNTEIIRFDLPSNHYTLFEEPAVNELASKINDIIAKRD